MIEQLRQLSQCQRREHFSLRVRIWLRVKGMSTTSGMGTRTGVGWALVQLWVSGDSDIVVRVVDGKCLCASHFETILAAIFGCGLPLHVTLEVKVWCEAFVLVAFGSYWVCDSWQ